MRYVVQNVRPKSNVYKKADVKSAIVGVMPETFQEATAEFATSGLRDDKIYWHIRFGSEHQYLSGYILEYDIIFETTDKPPEG